MRILWHQVGTAENGKKETVLLWELPHQILSDAEKESHYRYLMMYTLMHFYRLHDFARILAIFVSAEVHINYYAFYCIIILCTIMSDNTFMHSPYYSLAIPAKML